MGFFSLAFKNLLRHRIRSLLTVLAIAAGIFMLYSFLSFNKGYQAGLRRELGNMGAHMLAIAKGCPYEATAMIVHGGTITDYLTQEDLLRIREMPGVARAVGMFMNQKPLEHGKVTVIYGVDEEVFALKPWWVVRGDRRLAEDSVILPVDMAERLDVTLGDALTIPGIDREFRVVGLLERTGSQDDQFVYMSLSTAQQIFDAEDRLTSIAIQVEDLARIQDVVRQVESLPDVQAVTMTQVLGTVETLMTQAQAMVTTIVVVAIFISAIGVLNTILMSVFERTREIGMMKAVGCSAADIFALVWIESMLLSLAGGALGVAGAIGGGRLLEGAARALLPFVPAGSLIGADWRIAAVSIALSILLGIVAGAFPAYRASVLSPMEAIRSE
ncbi:MAG: ABC transporter permease [Bacillota bacterium]